MKLKVILVGNSEVGKTSIITQYTNQSFSEDYITTISSDKSFKKIEINNKQMQLEIWDTAGQEQFRSINTIFMKNTNIAILVYDVTNSKSFEELINWYNQVNDCNQNSSDLIFAVVGNKSDLYENQIVNKEEGESFCNKYKIDFFQETSAKDFECINKLFNDILLIYINKNINPKKEIENNNKNNENEEIDKKNEKNVNENDNNDRTQSISIDKKSFLKENTNSCAC